MSLFTVKVLRLDRLVVVAEVRTSKADISETQQWMGKLVEYVHRTNNVWLYALVLVPEGSLPKLASGLPDSFQSKRRFLDGTLSVHHIYMALEECIHNLPQQRGPSAENMQSNPMDRLVEAVRGVEHTTSEGPSFLPENVSYCLKSFLRF